MAWLRRIISPGGLTAVLALIPLFVLAGLVTRYAVDVPFFDQWSFSNLAAYYRNGGTDLGNLWAQHHEARMLFPTPVNLLCEYLSEGDLRACAVACLLLAGLSLFNIHRLAVVSLPSSPEARMAVTFVASLMIFSPVQWENWLWSHQIALFFPAACLTSAISVAYSGLRFRLKLGLCAALAFVATFSFPNGILCWVVVPFLLIWQPETGRGRAQAAACWLAAASGSLWLFFQGFHSPAGHSAWKDSLSDPKRMLLSFTGFLGAPLSFGDEFWVYRSGSLASLALLSLLAVAGFAIVINRDRDSLKRSAGWLVLCAFVLCSAGVTVLGRSPMSSVFLHDSRYTSFSIYLVIGVSGLLAVVFAKRRGWPVLIAAVLILHVSASAQAVQAMRFWRVARLQSKACLVLINVVDSPCTTTKLGPSRGQMLPVSEALDKLGLLHPPLFTAAQLSASLMAAEPLDAAYGKLAGLRRLADDSWIASGYAVLPGRDEPADGVVITYDDAQGVQHVAGLANTPTRMAGSELASQWVKWFVLPEGAGLVRAYAYDALAARFFSLSPAQNAAAAEASPLRFGTESSGWLDNLARGFTGITDPNEPLMAFGWSFLRGQGRTPDAILVTCDGAPKIVGSGEAHLPRPDIVRALGRDPRSLHSGYGALIDETRLPAGGCPLKAWAYDAASHMAQPLDQTRDSGLMPGR